MRIASRRTRWSTIAAVVLLVASTVTAGAQQSDDDLRAERERLRAEQAALAAELDVAEAELEEITAALDALEANVRHQEAQLEQAEREVVAAEEEVTAAEAAQAAKEAEVAELREQMAAIAVDAYVSPPQSDTLEVFLEGDLGTAPERQVLLDIRTSDTADVLERMRAAQEDLEIQAENARLARERAEQARADVETRLAELEAARAETAQVAAEANVRLHHMLEQQNQLARSEQEIDAELTRREEERRQEEARRLAELQRAINEANAPRGPISVPGGGSINLVRVGGIVVDASIASQLEAMLQAAAADGLTLTGGGYRDSSAQIALRRAHCGTSHYAVYEMSPGSCSPPTARPGTSNHERGLAIDFNYCSSRSTACYQWLARNASRYGFRNLPSEPWHWSVNGQ